MSILDFSTSNSQITDEVINVSDSNPIELNHDLFYNKAGKLVEIYTASGGGGTQLTEGTDYDVGGAFSDDNLPFSISPDTAYTTIAITNATHHDTDLYVSYYPLGDLFNAARYNDIENDTITTSGEASFGDTLIAQSNIELTGDITFNDIVLKILANTDDGSDTSSIGIGAGGDISRTRGAYIILAGNESVSYTVGNMYLRSGENGNIYIATSENVNIGYTSDQGYKLAVSGNADISGTLTAGSKSFKIDHPLRPDTHKLVHMSVEAPGADLIYSGTVNLKKGKAEVNIDTEAGMSEGTFEALCREIRTLSSNETGFTAVKSNVTGNILTIEAENAKCTDTISWLVIGERKDKHMYDTKWTDENGKVIVEPEKEKSDES